MLNKNSLIGILDRLIFLTNSEEKRGAALYELYYNALKDFTDEEVANGVNNLILKEKLYGKMPDISLLVHYAEKEKFLGYTKEDLEELNRVKKITKRKFKNDKLNYLCDNLKIEKEILCLGK